MHPGCSSLFIAFLGKSTWKAEQCPRSLLQNWKLLRQLLNSNTTETTFENSTRFFIRYLYRHCRPVRVWKVSLSVTQPLPFMSCVHADLLPTGRRRSLRPPPWSQRSPECVWAPVGSLKFNEQRKLPEEWKIPLSQGHSYQQKPDGAPSWLHYLCEIAFSPRKPQDFPHLPGP